MKIIIIQISNSFSNQSYFPYSAGLLEANAKKFAFNASELEFLLPIYKREPIEELENKCKGADIIAISLYIWNEQISLELARRIKEKSPNTIIIAGGPQVPNNSGEFLRKNKAISLVIHGEGERVFSKFLENPSPLNYVNLPSVSYIDSLGEYIKTKNIERENNLDCYASPYLSGVFDPLMKAYPDENWTALWETNRGCPFSCAYCDWGSNKKSKIGKYSIERLFAEIEWFVNNKIKYIYCCDANFGILQRDLDIVKYIADKKIKTGFPNIFSVQSTKNSTEKSFETQKIISSVGLSKGVSLSMQSLNPMTLKLINRDNIDQKVFDVLQYKFSKEKIATYSDLIIGLPGETYTSFKNGIEYLIANGQHNRIRFNNLTVLPNAQFGDPSYQLLNGIKIVKNKLVYVYGEEEKIADDVDEYQYLVVGTNSAKEKDWVKIRSFAWMTDLLYFDKTLQIPLMLLHRHFGECFQDLIELFMSVSQSQPIFYKISKFFDDKATGIQNGEIEYCLSEKFLNSYWKSDEYMLMNVVSDGDIMSFYNEARDILGLFIASKEDNNKISEIIEEAILLNQVLLKIPNDRLKKSLSCKYNILNWYEHALVGETVSLDHADVLYEIDKTVLYWEDYNEWSREVVWYGNRLGDYLHKDIQQNHLIANSDLE